MLLAMTSCTKDDVTADNTGIIEKKPELIEGRYVMWNLAPAGTVRLCCGMVDTTAVKDCKIRWYETKDSVVSLIEGAMNNYYDVNFEDKGIKNLKCEVTCTRIENDSTEVKEYPFLVAYTGLPALYITTGNGQPVINKTDKIPALLALSGGGADLIIYMLD